MFSSALLEHKLTRETYERQEPDLRTQLLRAQLELLERRGSAVLILVTGMDGAGKGEVIHRLLEWLDPRHVQVEAYGDPDEAERLRPRMWRYWRDLPQRGRIGVVFGSWYSNPLRDRLAGRYGRGRFERELAAIRRFEDMLTSEGILLLKLFLVVTADVQRKRLKAFADTTGGASRALEEWAEVGNRKAVRPIIEDAVRRTSSGAAPWTVLPSDDPEYRDLSFGRALLATLQRAVETPGAAAAARPVSAPLAISNLDERSAVDGLDLSRSLDEASYKSRREAAQAELLALTQRKAFAKRALMIVFEGNDAAGKGGAIRRVVYPLDPRHYRIHAIAAPSDEEKARPYLWRFWRRVPKQGDIAIFDRSWYGRLLVERVEGFASEAEWLRAYDEINDFEEELTRDGIVVVKFWLAISKDEQLRRFEARAQLAYKTYKITPEDWRNREKWDAYRLAAGDVVDRTSTPYAPWDLVAAEDKRGARISVLETLCHRLDAAL